MSSSGHQRLLPRQGRHDEQAPALMKPQQVKKQTRRRAHTSRRPYQERLLNMAEARREIVTALRIHRANMRQQQSKFQEQRQPRLQQQVMFQEQSSQQACEGLVVPPVAAPTSCGYAPFSAAADNRLLCSSLLAGNYYKSSPMLSYDLAASLQEEAPAAVTGGGLVEQLVCNQLVPAQPPLGLNLSFQGFGCGSLDTANKQNSCDDDPFGVPTIQPSSCCSAAASYSAPHSSPVTAMMMPGRHAGYSSAADAPVAESSQQALDGEIEMSRSTGERRGTAELMVSETTAANNVAAASAWWTKMLESVESGGETTATRTEVCKADDDDAVVGARWPELQWVYDDGGVEQEVAARPNKPDILQETVRVDNGGDNTALQCSVDIEAWDDGAWFS